MSKSFRETWRGVYAPILTPLREDESLDEAAFEQLAQSLLDEGQAGLYLTGGTGEEYAVEDAVRVAVFRKAARIVRERGDNRKLIAHTGGVSTKRAIALARAAADAGCQALAALTPHGGRYGYDELTGYYRDLAQATPLPLFVYHIPVVTGIDLEHEKLTRWLELPNVAGMKFTSHDMFKFERLVLNHPESAFFHGNDPMLMHGIAVGAGGAIGSSYNVLGAVAMHIIRSVEASDTPAALRGQRMINAFIDAMHIAGGVRALKAVVARRLGWKASASPAPGRPPAREVVEKLDAVLERCLREATELAPQAVR